MTCLFGVSYNSCHRRGGGTPKANEETGDACQEIYLTPLTPEKYQLKWNRLDYQLLFRKGAHISGWTQETGVNQV